MATAKLHPILLGEVGLISTKWISFLLKTKRIRTLGSRHAGVHSEASAQLDRLVFSSQSYAVMISDWSYTPTPFWGQFAKDALSGKQFELKRMR